MRGCFFFLSQSLVTKPVETCHAGVQEMTHARSVSDIKHFYL